MDSTDLLKALVKHYKSLDPKHPKSFFGKMGVVNVLKKLIEFRYYALLNRPKFCEALNEFLDLLKAGDDTTDLPFHDYLRQAMVCNDVGYVFPYKI